MDPYRNQEPLTWEYSCFVEDYQPCSVEAEWLNKLGAQGWDLVNKEDTGSKWRYVFKRPRQ